MTLFGIRRAFNAFRRKAVDHCSVSATITCTGLAVAQKIVHTLGVGRDHGRIPDGQTFSIQASQARSRGLLESDAELHLGNLVHNRFV